MEEGRKILPTKFGARLEIASRLCWNNNKKPKTKNKNKKTIEKNTWLKKKVRASSPH